MTWDNWLGITLTCLAGAASPGMSLAMILKHTLNDGQTAGIACGWAHAIGIGIYALLTVFGLSILFEQLPWLFTILLSLGGLYLLKIGLQSIAAFLTIHQSASSITPTLTTATEHHNGWRKWQFAIRDGFSIAILNPKTLLFFGAIFTVFIDQQSTAEKFGMAAIPPIIDGLWYSFVALIMGIGRIRRRFDAYQHWLNGIFGLVFIGYGMYLLFHGIKALP